MQSSRTAHQSRWWLKYGVTPFMVTTVAVVVGGGIGGFVVNNILDMGIHTSSDPVRVFIDAAVLSMVVSWPVPILLTGVFVAWVRHTRGDA